MRIAILTTKFEVGYVVVGRTDAGICAAALSANEADVAAELRRDFPDAEIVQAADDEIGGLQKTAAAIADGTELPDLTLDLHGTDFQKFVWGELRKIEFGETITYTELARRLGRPSAVRAVATACAANRIAVLIPCHRVIGHDGAITGYKWGPERKKWLLAREALIAGKIVQPELFPEW